MFWVGDRVPICGDGFVRVGCVCVCVVEGAYEPPKFGRVCERWEGKLGENPRKNKGMSWKEAKRVRK